MHFLNIEYLMCTISDPFYTSFTTLNVIIIIKDMYMISIGVVRRVLDTFSRPTDSWDEAVDGGGCIHVPSGEMYYEGNNI